LYAYDSVCTNVVRSLDSRWVILSVVCAGYCSCAAHCNCCWFM